METTARQQAETQFIKSLEGKTLRELNEQKSKLHQKMLAKAPGIKDPAKNAQDKVVIKTVNTKSVTASAPRVGRTRPNAGADEVAQTAVMSSTPATDPAEEERKLSPGPSPLSENQPRRNQPSEGVENELAASGVPSVQWTSANREAANDLQLAHLARQRAIDLNAHALAAQDRATGAGPRVENAWRQYEKHGASPLLVPLAKLAIAATVAPSVPVVGSIIANALQDSAVHDFVGIAKAAPDHMKAEAATASQAQDQTAAVTLNDQSKAALLDEQIRTVAAQVKAAEAQTLERGLVLNGARA